MDIRISDMVIRELLPDYDYNDAWMSVKKNIE